MAMAQQNLQELQRSAILRMLNLSGGGAEPWATGQTWKVLVYDKFSQEVVAPLLKVGWLMKHGVTLHLNINSERLPVADVPAVYFVEPTQANIDRIGEDLGKALYEGSYINFASSVPQSMLTDLARGATRAQASQKVLGVYDRFVSFVSLSASLFSLNLPSAFETIHSPKLTDQIIEQYIERIVDGLLSVLVTMRAVPIIRCAPNAASEMVARRLCQRMSALLRSSTGADLFTGGGSSGTPGGPRIGEAAGQRPLLCILDRDVDLSTMLGHTWTYQAMCHDVLSMRLNKIHVPDESAGGPNAKSKAYDIDDGDAFWAQHAAGPFPDVATAVHASIEEFKKKKDDMSRSGADDRPDESLAPGLAAAINALPEMADKKRSIDMHTNILTALLNEVKSRELDTYYEMEDQFASQSASKSLAQLLKIIQDPQKDNVRDTTRAFLVLYLTKPSITSDPSFSPLVTALREAGGDVASLDFLQHLMGMRNMMAPVAPASQAPAAAGAASLIGNLADRMRSTGEGLLTAGMSNIKNIVASKKDLAACSIVSSLMEQKQNPATDNFLYLDPKASGGAAGGDQPRMRSPFRRAITFVVGGGSYVEMQSLQEWAQEQGRQITYGSTDMVSPTQFLEELAKLGQALGGSGAGGADLR